MSTLTVDEKRVENDAWLEVVRKEFARVVKALQTGEVPSNLKPKTEQLTDGEWLAVLEAARREVARRA